ncbi:MAG: hypothetical protein KBS62_07785 [Oscillospiraceae bacterium]|nr:hypothetical protein [Candidatus Ruminococcus equi]
MQPLVFPILCFILALYLAFEAVRGDTFLFVPAVFFVFMALWYAAKDVFHTDLSSPIATWIFRAVGIVTLVLCIFRFFTYKKKDDTEKDDTKDDTK